MEKLTCGIIQDLLPSYRDGLTGEAVTELLQEHLAECPKCQCAYEEIRQQQEMADNIELSMGRKFRNKLRSIRYYIIGFLIGLMLPVLFIIIRVIYNSLCY